MPDVLIIDDDDRLAAMVAEYLGRSGITVQSEPTVERGLATLFAGSFDAVLLDVMLPDGDGFDVCKTIRVSSCVPIVMLTARGEDTDRIVGLELGADDYLPKPFNPRELLARLRAVLRRSQVPVDTAVQRRGALTIDRGARTVALDGELVPLTAHQYGLLALLADNPGRVLSRDELSQGVRGEDVLPWDRSIDVHISRIRQLIEPDPKRPERILTVRGMGYVFAAKQP